MKNVVLALMIVLLAGASLIAADSDWPMWGHSQFRNMYNPKSKDLPVDIKPGQYKEGTDHIEMAGTKNVRWICKTGSLTYGNPVVADGRVYVGTNNDGRNDPRFKGDYSLLKCIDEKTGKEIWTLTVPKLGSGKVGDWEYLGICSSPAVEGDRVYVTTNRCEIMCLDVNGLANGNQGETDEAQYMAGPGKPPVPLKPTDPDIIWHYSMADDLGVFPHNITASSPLVVGDLVYSATSNGVDWSHTNIPNPKAPTLVCVNKKTGELAGFEDSGLSQRIFHSDWTSPSYAKVNGKGLIIFGGPDGVCYAFDPIPVKNSDGDGILKEVWRFDANPVEYRYLNGDSTQPIKYATPKGPSEIIATPSFYDGNVYVAIGQDPEHGEGIGCLTCINPNGKGDITQTNQVWRYKGIHRSLSTASIENGLLFIADFSGVIHCIDAKTGKVYWTHDSLSHIWGSTLVADGKVYVGDEDGELLIFNASKEKKLLNTVTFNDPIYSTPVASGDTIYLATTSQLYALGKTK